MANEVLMVIKITIAMLGGNVFPVDVEMITTQEPVSYTHLRAHET